MESAGGINEIANFYVGTSLSNSYAQANAAFSSKVYYANGVDYTSQAAINSISYISQAEANYYINQGAALAYSQGNTWGCVPGAYTNMAVNMYATDVNRRKDSANSQIYNIRQNKQAAHDAWVEEQIRLAQEAAYKKWLEQCAAMAIAFMQERDRQTALRNAMMDAAMNAANSVFGAIGALASNFPSMHIGTNPVLGDVGTVSSYMGDFMGFTMDGVRLSDSPPMAKVGNYLHGASKVVGAVGNGLNIYVDVTDTLDSGGNFQDVMVNSAWDIAMTGIGAAGAYGAAGSFILSTVNLLSGGALEEVFNSAVELEVSGFCDAVEGAIDANSGGPTYFFF
jgi:hypothetical protein